MKKIYRVVVRTGTPQDRAQGQTRTEVLYCGTDIDYARIAYHKSKPEDYGGGSYTLPMRNTVFQKSKLGE